MEKNAETTPAEARVLDAYYASARLVWAAIDAPSDRSTAEWDAALADLWTGDPAEDDARTALLVEALADYAAVLARKAYGARRDARDEAFMQVWAMLPDEAATRALIARQLQAADDILSCGE
jgi:hypothetical protein